MMARSMELKIDNIEPNLIGISKVFVMASVMVKWKVYLIYCLKVRQMMTLSH